MRLSRQELRVAMWLDSPYSHCEIAQRLHMTLVTYRSYCKRLYIKRGAENRIQAIREFERHGR